MGIHLEDALNQRWLEETRGLPAVPTVSALVEDGPGIEEAREAEPRLRNPAEKFREEPAILVNIETLLELREVRLHVLRTPGIVVGKIRYLLPVPVVRTDDDHRMVRGAAADPRAARVENAARPVRVAQGGTGILMVVFLAVSILVMPYRELPA